MIAFLPRYGSPRRFSSADPGFDSSLHFLPPYVSLSTFLEMDEARVFSPPAASSDHGLPRSMSDPGLSPCRRFDSPFRPPPGRRSSLIILSCCCVSSGDEAGIVSPPSAQESASQESPSWLFLSHVDSSFVPDFLSPPWRSEVPVFNPTPLRSAPTGGRFFFFSKWIAKLPFLTTIFGPDPPTPFRLSAAPLTFFIYSIVLPSLLMTTSRAFFPFFPQMNRFPFSRWVCLPFQSSFHFSLPPPFVSLFLFF